MLGQQAGPKTVNGDLDHRLLLSRNRSAAGIPICRDASA
jgi:hypothetical protein